MTTKFENRTTVAHAVIVNFEEGKLEEKSVVIPYTRTLSNAIKHVATALDVAPNCVTIRELEQTEFRANEVGAAALLNIAKESGLEEKPESVPEGCTCVPYTDYQYIGFFFGYDEDNTPVAFRADFCDTEKMGKTDAKNKMIRECESNGYKTFAVDFKQRHEAKRYAIVDSAEYQELRYAK